MQVSHSVTATVLAPGCAEARLIAKARRVAATTEGQIARLFAAVPTLVKRSSILGGVFRVGGLRGWVERGKNCCGLGAASHLGHDPGDRL